MTLTLRPTAADLAAAQTSRTPRFVTNCAHGAWRAWLLDGSAAIVGRGPTEAAAIADLDEQLAAEITRAQPGPRWLTWLQLTAIFLLTPILFVALIWCAWALCILAGLTQ